MSSTNQTTSADTSQMAQGSARNWLIAGLLAVAAAIIFGLLYLFVIAPSVPNGSLGWYLFSFATGLTMIVMPCTLPLAFVIVPLSMGKGMIKGLSMALSFGLGVAFTLSLYGIVAALLGNIALTTLGVGIEPLKNWVYFIAGIFALLFALSEIGLMNFHMPTYSGAAPAFIQKRQEVIKAFLLGAFLGNVGVGCPHPATPLILIEIASSGDVLYGWTLFLIHAVGRVLPLLLLAFLAILGVNGLNWLMARKDAVERTTGWAMVFVAGFILTLGLFSHDWWVNSGLHTGLEKLTGEHAFNVLLNRNLGTDVQHVHGLATGQGLFGLPLELGSWFLVAVWLVPMWWWWFKKRKDLLKSPANALKSIEAQIDRLEADRRQMETVVEMNELDPSFDLVAIESQMDDLESKRRQAEEHVQFGEKGTLKDPIARSYEFKLLGLHRNYLIAVSFFLAVLFIHYLPTTFYLSQTSSTAAHPHPTAPISTATTPAFTPFTKSTAGLPDAKGAIYVELSDGDSYDISASYVKKEVGNRQLRMLAYNGSVPGPFIKVKEGSTVTIHFTNNTDIDQTIHSHGLRLQNLFDGVPNVTQDVVKPGEKFTYTLDFPDAGVAWYHPHTRDDYGQEMGLYGNYIIDSNEVEYWSPVNREIPFIVDDILIENDQIADFYKETVDHALLGRFGNTYLVNGDVDSLTNVQAGEVVRLLITNVSNTRTYNFSIPGAQMKLVGAEWGRYEQEEYKDTFLISPAERAVVEVYFPKKGLYKLINNIPDKPTVVAQFSASEEFASPSYLDAFNVTRRNSNEKALFDSLRQEYLAKEPDKRALLTVQLTGMIDHSAHAHGGAATAMPTAPVDESMPHDHSMPAAPVAMPMMQMKSGIDSIQWDDPTNSDKVNNLQNVTWKIVDEKTKKESMLIDDWVFKQGQFVKIRFTNDSFAMHVMQHPIHFHGQRFVVLSNNGVPNQNMVWKDTALVPPGEYIDILVEMSNTGEWMAHCHISEHLHAGMMLQFRVEDTDGNANGDEYRNTVSDSRTQSVNTPEGTNTNQMGQMNMGQMPMAVSDTPELLPYNYSDRLADTSYTVSSDIRFAEVGKETLIALTFSDSQGNAMTLDETLSRALDITFVKDDNSIKFVTYPGNTVFPEILNTPSNSNVPGTPGFDESMPHSHSSFLKVPIAYAHNGEVDGHILAAGGRVYSVPVRFPIAGNYKGFVSFTLAGETSPRVATFDIEVGTKSFNINNFGLNKSTQWWLLLIISFLLMAPLIVGVRKYINAN